MNSTDEVRKRQLIVLLQYVFPPNQRDQDGGYKGAAEKILMLMKVEAEPPRMNTLGFQIIDDMTNEEMIEEAIAFQRGQWVRASRNILKKFVVEARLHFVKARLIEEAKFEPEAGPFGMLFSGGIPVDDN